jgi:hypothetical protein
MCSYLEWELTVDATTLKNFETMVRKDFNGQGPYPTYVMSMFSNKKPESSSPPSHPPLPPPNSSTSPIPMFGNTNSSTPPPPPKTPYEQQKLQQVPLRKSVKASTVTRYMSPPNTPPSPFHSDSPSPSSSASSDGPVTPIGDNNNSVGIASASSSPTFTMEVFKKPVTHPLKPKMFAFAASTGW